MKKTLLFLLAFIPIIITVIGSILLVAQADSALALLGLIIIIFAVFIGSLGVIIFIIFVWLAKNLSIKQKIIWSIVLLLLNIIVFPIYWIVQVRIE